MSFKSKVGIIATTLFTTATMFTALTSALLLSNSAYAKDKDHDHKHRHDEVEMLALKSSDTSIEQALTTFRSQYPGTIVEVELDHEDDQMVYEVKAIDLDGHERLKIAYAITDLSEVDSDRDSLSLLGFNKLDDEDVSALETVQAEGAITIDRAIEIAKANSAAFIKSVELEHKRGLTYYEVKMFDENGKQRLLIDAKSGEAIPSMRRK